MLNHCFQEIDFARYQRWLDRAMGVKTPFMVCDRDGLVVWNDGVSKATELGLSISTGDDKEQSGVCRLDLDDRSTALHQSLGRTKEGLLGRAAVIVECFAGDDAPINLDHLTEAMEDLCASIHDEYVRSADLEMMTEELGARYEELHLVYAVDQHVRNQTEGHESVFQSLLKSTTEHLNVDVVAFVRPSQNLCLYATSLSKEIHNLDLVLVEMRGDLYRFIQSSREAVVLNSPDDPRRAYIFTDMPYKVLACPVRTERQVDSLVVLLNHAHKPDFTNSDRKLADVLANQLSSLSNTYLLLDSMREFNEQMAQALIEAVEAKDPYTRGHSERVNFISMEIGKAMGLSPTELENLHWGSLLHDVGKIGVPDAVLCKPSALTKDEYTFIMVHPERSYEILRHIKHLADAIPGARHHQEKYNGTGYPHGLKGDRIPLHARIMAIADTYDSITSSRAYRAGRSHETAMAEIIRVSGTQLDPAITEVFKRIVADEPEWLLRFNIRRDKV